MMNKNGVFLVVFAVFIAIPLFGRPHVGYLYPAGISQNSRVRVLVGGQKLSGVAGVFVSGKGVRVTKITPVRYFPHPDSEQRKYLQNWIKKIEHGDTSAPQIPENAVNWRKHPWWLILDQLPHLEFELVKRNLYIRKNSLQDNPSLKQLLIIDLEADKDAETGMHELVLWNRKGEVSAPKLFFVDAAPHQAEGGFNIPEFPVKELPVIRKVPVILNGQIMPGECDSFKIFLERNVRYVFKSYGRKFQPFIGDAVPGHFQMVMQLFSPSGKPEVFADDNGSDPDPVLYYTPRRNGLFTLQIRDNLYRGREDFVYRIVIEKASREAEKESIANPFAGNEPIPESAAANQIFPADKLRVFHGKISSKNEKDSYFFRGKKGQRFFVRTSARNNNSQLDAVLRIFDRNNKLLAQVDDTPHRYNVGEVLQQSDPVLDFVFPADGVYRLEISDITASGSDKHFYHLYCSKKYLDFNVYTSTSTAAAAPGRKAVVPLLIERVGGFEGKIVIRGKNLPAGEITLPEKSTQGSLTVVNTNKFNALPEKLEFIAEAEINGKIIRKKVIPCEIFNQAFAYDHLLPMQNFYLGTPYRSKAAKQMKKVRRKTANDKKATVFDKKAH